MKSFIYFLWYFWFIHLYFPFVNLVDTKCLLVLGKRALCHCFRDVRLLFLLNILTISTETFLCHFRRYTFLFFIYQQYMCLQTVTNRWTFLRKRFGAAKRRLCLINHVPQEKSKEQVLYVLIFPKLFHQATWPILSVCSNPVRTLLCFAVSNKLSFHF